MTPELKYLALTALLSAALWIPYIVCQVMTNGGLKPVNYVDPTPRPTPVWGQRAHRAYLNAAEPFAPFAALILLLHVAGRENPSTAMWALVFFWARLVHAVVYWFAIPFIRTIAFTIGFIAVCGLAWQALV